MERWTSIGASFPMHRRPGDDRVPSVDSAASPSMGTSGSMAWDWSVQTPPQLWRGFRQFPIQQRSQCWESRPFFSSWTPKPPPFPTQDSQRSLLCAPDNIRCSRPTRLRRSLHFHSLHLCLAARISRSRSARPQPRFPRAPQRAAHLYNHRQGTAGTAHGRPGRRLPPCTSAFGPASSGPGRMQRYGDGGLRTRDPCRRCSGHGDDKRYSHGDRKSKQCRDGGRVRDRSGPRGQGQDRDDDRPAI